MDVDPVVALATSIQAAPGTFALLLGSGVSVSSRVPTGWDVVVDLVRRVAVLTDGVEPDDPIEWFRTRSGGDGPDYSTMLEQLAPTAADRRNLLNGYFEPTDGERSEGLKVPTPAHHEIARLVVSGHTRVIVTPNFDRLLETAIRQAGIEPVVISTPAAAEGATPLVHSRCTVIKVHGDYLDPDLKNTVAELGSYAPAIDALLDRVFDEYGIVICGWSGVWDEALRNAILRAPNRRYGMYWAHVSPLAERAAQLVAHRGAVTIPIEGADDFFEDLVNKVVALDELRMRRTMTTSIATAELKRFLPDPIYRIKLHDLMHGESRRAISLPEINANAPQPTRETVEERMHEYEATVSTLVPLLITFAYFADTPDHDALLVDVIKRLAARSVEHSGYNMWIDLERYPAVLAFYALAIGAVAVGRLSPLIRAFEEVVVPHPNGPISAVTGLTSSVLDGETCNAIVTAGVGAKRKTPVSDYLHDLLGPMVTDIVPEADFDRVFDEVEYLFGVVAASKGRWAPIGRWVWKNTFSDDVEAAAVVSRHKADLLAAGLFEGSETKVDEVVQRYMQDVRSTGLRF